MTLNGSGSSDPDVGQTLTYAWTAPAGVTLSNASAASPTFTAPSLPADEPDSVLTFSLIVTDNLGLSSTADTVSIRVVSGPSVQLSGGPSAINTTSPFTITATFSKDVTGFTDVLNDVIVTNGSVTGITGGPAVYQVTVTPTGNGDMSISVPFAAAQDGIGNNNAASGPLVIDNQIVETTQEAIASFMLRRANNLASNQPDVTRFLMGEGCGAFAANATSGSGFVNGCVSQGNTWAAISSSWSEGGAYTLGTVGSHAFLNENLLLGVLLQFDQMDDPDNNVSGTGWMMGPYFVAKSANQPLFLEGRVLYGQTSNDIAPRGTYLDTFETERWLANLQASGEYKLEQTILIPLLGFSYTSDEQKAYVDRLGNIIPDQMVEVSQLTMGVDFRRPMQVRAGNLEIRGGLAGVYSSTVGTGASPEFESWRGKSHFGIDYATGLGSTLGISAFYDGFGSEFESFGANLNFDLRF